MRTKRILSLLLCLTMVSLSVDSFAAAPNSPDSLISVALSQLDYEEGARSYSKYGQWYGIAHGDWCDMFVSWCGNQAGLSPAAFPRSASCTAHMKSFLRMERYHDSAARGGSYIPKQGDLIFFFNPDSYPDGSILQHVGIVLCVEKGHVFTIEGNTLTIRLDERSYYEAAAEAAAELSDSEKKALRPNDYVAVKHYPLDWESIHGYAEPYYENQTEYVPDGFVDLGKYEALRAVFDALDASGIMPATSSYTFSPRYGVTRGEFLCSVMALYGLRGWDASDSIAFDDVPEDSACYEAVMTARAAGIVYGNGDNAFLPDLYISAPEAQTILSRTLQYVGLADRTFAFSEGDFSYLMPYTIRADIARALYELFCETVRPEE